MESSCPPLFTIGNLCSVELHSEDIPELQSFFDANPEYFLAVEGRPAGPTEAYLEFIDKPPDGWSYTKKWLLGFVDVAGSLVGMAEVISDLLAQQVWHIGLFIIATIRHGNGDAQVLYQSLEDWVVQNGAHWLRLGVVAGNGRAERFWQKMGYVEVSRRNAVEMGDRVNTIRIMVKPLTGGTIAEYLALVPRDQPEL